MRRLQDVALQQEREKLQQHAAWTQEKQLMEKELSLHKEKVSLTTSAIVASPGIDPVRLIVSAFTPADSRVFAGSGA